MQLAADVKKTTADLAGTLESAVSTTVDSTIGPGGVNAVSMVAGVLLEASDVIISSFVMQIDSGAVAAAMPKQEVVDGITVTLGVPTVAISSTPTTSNPCATTVNPCDTTAGNPCDTINKASAVDASAIAADDQSWRSNVIFGMGPIFCGFLGVIICGWVFLRSMRTRTETYSELVQHMPMDSEETAGGFLE